MRTESNYNNSTKIESRLLNLSFYRHVSGSRSIPSNQVYVTLCSNQTSNENSEISQVLSSGFARPEQFVGIDKSHRIIKENRRLFPRSVWIAGRWRSVLRDLDLPVAVAYLDTCYVGDSRELLEDVVAVIRRSRPGTCLFVNAITGSRGQWAMSRPGKPIDDGYIPRMLSAILQSQRLGEWDLNAAGHIYRNPNGNYMLTRAFVRKD